MSRSAKRTDSPEHHNPSPPNELQDEDIYVNGMADTDLQELQELLTAIEDFSDLPTSIVITGVEPTVFSSPAIKAEFERVFTNFSSGGEIEFVYLRSFRRVRITYTSPDCAVRAKLCLHGVKLCGSQIKCYLAEVPANEANSTHLKPPEPVRQWLISPPSSPPVGWAPVREAPPIVNYDLVNAVLNMAVSEEDGPVAGSYEVEPARDDKPSIVISICGDHDQEEAIKSTPSSGDRTPATGPESDPPSAVQRGDSLESNGDEELPLPLKPRKPKKKIRQTRAPISLIHSWEVAASQPAPTAPVQTREAANDTHFSAGKSDYNGSERQTTVQHESSSEH